MVGYTPIAGFQSLNTSMHRVAYSDLFVSLLPDDKPDNTLHQEDHVTSTANMSFRLHASSSGLITCTITSQIFAYIQFVHNISHT